MTYDEPMPWMELELRQLGVIKKKVEAEQKPAPPPPDEWWKRGEECPF